MGQDLTVTIRSKYGAQLIRQTISRSVIFRINLFQGEPDHLLIKLLQLRRPRRCSKDRHGRSKHLGRNIQDSLIRRIWDTIEASCTVPQTTDYILEGPLIRQLQPSKSPATFTMPIAIHPNQLVGLIRINGLLTINLHPIIFQSCLNLIRFRNMYIFPVLACRNNATQIQSFASRPK